MFNNNLSYIAPLISIRTIQSKNHTATLNNNSLWTVRCRKKNEDTIYKFYFYILFTSDEIYVRNNQRNEKVSSVNYGRTKQVTDNNHRLKSAAAYPTFFFFPDGAAGTGGLLCEAFTYRSLFLFVFFTGGKNSSSELKPETICKAFTVTLARRTFSSALSLAMGWTGSASLGNEDEVGFWKDDRTILDTLYSSVKWTLYLWIRFQCGMHQCTLAKTIRRTAILIWVII